VATRVMLTRDDAFGCLIVSTRPGLRLKMRWENSWPGFGGGANFDRGGLHPNDLELYGFNNKNICTH
jgi:hypothetical protein